MLRRSKSHRMFTCAVWLNLALLCAICIIATSVFPAHMGPYTAVQGPASDIESVQYAMVLMVAIAAAAAFLLGWHIPSITSSFFTEDRVRGSAQVNMLDLNCVRLV